MKPVVVVYATRHGHCARIAERVLDSLRGRGLEAVVLNAAKIPPGFSLEDYAAAMLIAPTHLGRHEAEMTRFVKANLSRLSEMTAAFLSVSLSQAGAEGVSPSPEMRAQAAADASGMIDKFLKDTGWHPSRIQAIAGALLYTKYNFLMRLVMKRIASRAGADTDVKQDHDYTNWAALDKFCGDFARQLWEDGSDAAPAAGGLS